MLLHSSPLLIIIIIVITIVIISNAILFVTILRILFSLSLSFASVYDEHCTLCRVYMSAYASAPVFNPCLCSFYMFTAHRAIPLKTEKDNVATRMDKVWGKEQQNTYTNTRVHAPAQKRSSTTTTTAEERERERRQRTNKKTRQKTIAICRFQNHDILYICACKRQIKCEFA